MSIVASCRNSNYDWNFKVCDQSEQGAFSPEPENRRVAAATPTVWREPGKAYLHNGCLCRLESHRENWLKLQSHIGKELQNYCYLSYSYNRKNLASEVTNLQFQLL